MMHPALDAGLRCVVASAVLAGALVCACRVLPARVADRVCQWAGPLFVAAWVAAALMRKE